MLILDALRSCLLAGVVLGLIPVVWWWFKGRKQVKFTLYFGLIRPKKTRQAAFMIGMYSLIWGDHPSAVFYTVYPAFGQSVCWNGKCGNPSDFGHQFHTDRVFGRISVSGLSEQAAG